MSKGSVSTVRQLYQYDLSQEKALNVLKAIHRATEATKATAFHRKASYKLDQHSERYNNNITDEGKGIHELNFSIASLNGLQRLAWGLDLRAESLSVFLKFPDGKEKNYVSFCIHASTDNEDSEERHLRHSYCSIKGSDPIMTPCSPRSAILTCVLSRELYGFTGLRHCRDPVVIYDKALQLIDSDPTKHCLICGKNFEAEFQVKLYLPTACLGNCMQMLDKWPLRARLSHLLSDFKTLDSLLCIIYSAVDGQRHVKNLYHTKDSLLMGCTLQLDEIQPTIDSFPNLSDKLGISDLLNAGGGHLWKPRKRLLSRLTTRVRGCMVSLKPVTEFFAGGKDLEKCHQFMLLNSVLERHAGFVKNVKKVGVGSVAFHGCKASRTFSILTDALRNMWGQRYVIEESGIFFSDQPTYSYSYSVTPSHPERPFRAWKSSRFSGRSWAVIFGLEVAMSHISFQYSEFSTHDEGLLTIRYVFLIPIGDILWRGPNHLNVGIRQGVMKKAFKALDEGTLNPKKIGLRLDKSGWKSGKADMTGDHPRQSKQTCTD